MKRKQDEKEHLMRMEKNQEKKVLWKPIEKKNFTHFFVKSAVWGSSKINLKTEH